MNSLFWMMIVGRGIAGFGAGGEYPGRFFHDLGRGHSSEVLRRPVCGTSSAEASDESAYVRKRRGILVAMSTDFAIDLVSDELDVQFQSHAEYLTCFVYSRAS